MAAADVAAGGEPGALDARLHAPGPDSGGQGRGGQDPLPGLDAAASPTAAAAPGSPMGGAAGTIGAVGAISGEGGEGYEYPPGEWAAATTRAHKSGDAKQ